MKSIDIGGCSKIRRIVLDTSVLVEYILSRSPYRLKVTSLFDKVKPHFRALTISGREC